MLALASNVVYLHEPFHVGNYRPGFCKARFIYWFTYLKPEIERPYYPALRNTIGLHYDLFAAVRRSPLSLWRWNSELRNYLQFCGYRLAAKRALLKDPIAVLSAEYLAQRFGVQVLVLVRHPAAFADSLLRAGWSHPFQDFLNQPILMRDHLEPFRDEILEYAGQPPAQIDQACLLWRIIYSVILVYRQRHRDWMFVRHEDISREPVRNFQTLYGYLGLEITPGIEATIREHSKSPRPDNPEPNAKFRRDSEVNIKSWQRTLTAAQIDHIRSNVEDVSCHFYADEDWC